MKRKLRQRRLIITLGALAVLAILAVCFVPSLLAVVFTKKVVGLALANGPAVLPTELIEQVKSGVLEMKDALKQAVERLTGAEGKITALETEKKEAAERQEQTEKEFDKLRKQWLTRGSVPSNVRRPGFVSDECARQFGAIFVLGHAGAGRFDSLGGKVRDALITEARSILGIEAKAALTTTDIPLPTVFTGEIKELIAEFGVVRRSMMPYPIGQGTSRPPRMGTRPAFASIAMSAAFAEKSPTITFASLESHKIGGIVRTPREIDEQSIVPLGQFLARYGAIEFARAEDTWGILADGTGTYESVKGVTKVCSDLNQVVTLAAGKTAPSDATVDDFRTMRGLVASPVLGSGKYYLHPTWERRLRTFKTQADPFIYVQNGPGGVATLDGYPIVWTDVMQPYGTAAAASKYLALFADLNYWFFGEHGNPRVDFSKDVYFTTDELATRFIEEVDFDYAASDAASALATPAA